MCVDRRDLVVPQPRREAPGSSRLDGRPLIVGHRPLVFPMSPTVPGHRPRPSPDINITSDGRQGDRGIATAHRPFIDPTLAPSPADPPQPQPPRISITSTDEGRSQLIKVGRGMGVCQLPRLGGPPASARGSWVLLCSAIDLSSAPIDPVPSCVRPSMTVDSLLSLVSGRRPPSTPPPLVDPHQPRRRSTPPINPDPSRRRPSTPIAPLSIFLHRSLVSTMDPEPKAKFEQPHFFAPKPSRRSRRSPVETGATRSVAHQPPSSAVIAHQHRATDITSSGRQGDRGIVSQLHCGLRGPSAPSAPSLHQSPAANSRHPEPSSVNSAESSLEADHPRHIAHSGHDGSTAATWWFTPREGWSPGLVERPPGPLPSRREPSCVRPSTHLAPLCPAVDPPRPSTPHAPCRPRPSTSVNSLVDGRRPSSPLSPSFFIVPKPKAKFEQPHFFCPTSSRRSRSYSKCRPIIAPRPGPSTSSPTNIAQPT